MRVVHTVSLHLLVLILLLSHFVDLCSGAATWSVNVASGFTSLDYNTLLSTINNAQDANWVVEPPGSSTPQPARITWPGGGNWPGTAWLSNGPLSTWMSVSANDYKLGAGGPYNFTRTFNVPSAVVASSVVFTGAVSCDNDCNLLFNGVRISPYWSSTYAALVPFTINLGSSIRPGQLNVLRINLTDYGSQNAVRIQGTISGTLANYWSVNVATGWTTSDYSGTVSNTNAAKDAHWMVKRPTWNQAQAAEICTPNGGNWPYPIDPWVPNGPSSDWIAVGCTSYSQGSGGPYDFIYTFTLPAQLDPYSVTFVGSITCDDDCNVLINGNVVGPHYTQAYMAMRYFSYDYSAGWLVGGANTITMNLTDTGSYNGVRMQGTIQARTRASSSSSTGRFVTSSSSRRCPYWAGGTYWPRCYCPGEGTFPYCDCPAPYKGEIPYDCYAVYPDPTDPDYNPGTSTGVASSSSSGLSTAVIVVIVLAIAVLVAIGGYLYWKHFRQPSANSNSSDNWHDKTSFLPNQTNTSHINHLGAPASATSHPQPPQGGLDYYMTTPATGQPGGQRPGVELH